MILYMEAERSEQEQAETAAYAAYSVGHLSSSRTHERPSSGSKQGAPEEIGTDSPLPSVHRRAYDMRRDGESYQTIADALGVAKSTAHAYVERAARNLEFRPHGIPIETAIENDRLNRWYSRVEAAYDTGEDIERLEKAVKMASQLSRDRRALLGLDAPRRLSVRDEDKSGPPPAPDMVLLEELRKATEQAQRMAELEEEDGLTP